MTSAEIGDAWDDPLTIADGSALETLAVDDIDDLLELGRMGFLRLACPPTLSI